MTAHLVVWNARELADGIQSNTVMDAMAKLSAIEACRVVADRAALNVGELNRAHVNDIQRDLAAMAARARDAVTPEQWAAAVERFRTNGPAPADIPDRLMLLA